MIDRFRKRSHDNQWFWAGRLISLVSAAWWLLAGIASALSESGPMTWESWMMATMIVGAIVITAFAWRRPNLGGMTMALFGVAFSTFAAATAGRNHWLAVLVTGVPFIVAGASYLASLRSLPTIDW